MACLLVIPSLSLTAGNNSSTSSDCALDAPKLFEMSHRGNAAGVCKLGPDLAALPALAAETGAISRTGRGSHAIVGRGASPSKRELSVRKLKRHARPKASS